MPCQRPSANTTNPHYPWYNFRGKVNSYQEDAATDVQRFRISVETRDRLLRALSIYSSELKEIKNAIDQQARFAGRKSEDYVPKDLSDEITLTSASLSIVNSFRARESRLFGENVRLLVVT